MILRVRSWFAAFCNLAGGLACLTASAATPARPSFAWNDYLRPHRLVEMGGGRRLNLFCLGAGSPTVILDAGLGDDISSWRKVHARLAARTRVCAYDRAGFGFSDPGPLPRTAEALSDDLERLLRSPAGGSTESCPGPRTISNSAVRMPLWRRLKR